MSSGRVRSRFQKLKDTLPKRDKSVGPHSPGPNAGARSASQSNTTKVKANTQEPVDNSAFVHRDLWDEAYKLLRNDTHKSALLDRYERVISTVEALEPLGPLGTQQREAQLAAIIDTRLGEVEMAKMKYDILGREIVVDEVVTGIVQKIISAKDFVSTAVSSEPHAALAWAGVCIVLPLLLNPVIQQSEALRGLELISNLITRYRITEMTYRDSESRYSDMDEQSSMQRLKSALEGKIIDVYARILEFQMCMAYHYSHGRMLRVMREIVVTNDWKTMLKEVEDGEGRVNSDLQALDSERIRQGFSQISVERVRRLTKEKTDKRREILSALSSSLDYVSTRNAVPLKENGTGQWFLSHPYYRKWHASQESCFLFLTAGPGYGKSVLMRSLAESDIAPSETEITCYFFFRDVGEQQKSTTEALSAILHQLFSQRPDLLDLAEGTFSQFGPNMSKRFTSLWDLLVKCAEALPKPICCILDALDECDNEKRTELVEAFQQYYGRRATRRQSKGALKFLVSGRPYLDSGFSAEELTDSLPDEAHLAAEGVPVPQEEMDIVIKARVQKLKLADNMKDYLANQLSEKQSETRTYLWLKLVFDYLQRNPKLRNAGKNTIDLLVEDTPPSLDAAYEKILGRTTDPDLTRNILHLILAALRPLTVTEINVALKSGYSDLQPDEDFQRTMISVCGLFVTIVERRVYLLHQSAKDFLEAPVGVEAELFKADGPRFWRGSFSKKISHMKMSVTCMLVLGFKTFQDDPLNNEDIRLDPFHASQDHRLDRKDPLYDKDLERILLLQTYGEHYPFLEYAASNWLSHISHGIKIGIDHTNSGQYRRKLMTGLCDLSEHTFWTWFFATVESSAFRDDFNISARDKDAPTISLQSDVKRCESLTFGLRTIIQASGTSASADLGIDLGLEALFGARFLTNVSSQNSFNCWKASKGFNLLEAFLGPRGKAQIDQYQLSQKAEDGDEEACEALFSPNYDRFQVLKDLSYLGLHKTFGKLLGLWVAENLGADVVEVIIPLKSVEKQTTFFRNFGRWFEGDLSSFLLLREAEKEHEASVRRLLECGVSPHVKLEDLTPLHLLWDRRSSSIEPIASLLLEHGTDINAQERRGQTALFASVGKKWHCARLLFFLKNGGDISIRDSDGYQALEDKDFDDPRVQDVIALRIANGEPAEKFSCVAPREKAHEYDDVSVSSESESCFQQ